MLMIVLVVCLVVVMLLWMLTLLGVVSPGPNASSWLAWFAVLFLALIVVLGSSGAGVRL